MKKVTILFGDRHLSYSPTVIGLYDLLSTHFDVTIVSKGPGDFNNKPLPNRKVIYIDEKRYDFVSKIVRRLTFEVRALVDHEVSQLRKKNVHYSGLHEFEFIKSYLSREVADIVIAVDFKTLSFARVLDKNVEFLSLEIKDGDEYHDGRDLKNIDSVIIQTPERYKYLFGDEQIRTFFVQNAPVFLPPEDKRERRGLVYCGTAWDAFGFYHVLEFLKQFPDDSLTVKGAILDDDRKRVGSEYGKLIAEKRLIIDDNYLDDADVVNYLRRFRIGFCFYNFDIKWVNNFNYLSAPAGKLFKYIAAAVPVVGIDVPGLKLIEEFDCGKLIKDLNPKSIRKALDEIEENFEYYSENCLTAAEHFSFDKAAKPFVDYLLEKNR